MTTTSHACDRCGAEIARDRVFLIAKCGRPPGWAVDQRYGRPTVDLCPSCAESLGEWLTTRPARSETMPLGRAGR